jgi:HEAT repeat protein
VIERIRGEELEPPIEPSIEDGLDVHAEETPWGWDHAYLARAGSRATSALLEAWDAASYGDERGQMVRALARLGPAAAPAVDRFLTALSGGGEAVRVAALGGLGELALDPDRVVPAAVNCLGDPSGKVRFAALSVLFQFSSAIGPDLAPTIEGLFQDEDLEVEVWARVLFIKRFARERRLEIWTAALDARRDVQFAALSALSHLGSAAAPAIPRVLRVLREEPEPLVRTLAASCLADIGAGAPGVAEALEESARSDPSEKVRTEAREALEKLGHVEDPRDTPRRPSDADDP